MASQAAACLALLVAAWYAVSAVVAWRRLRTVSGPALARFSYLWIAGAALSGRSSDRYRALDRRHGSLVRVGPNELLTSDPAVMRAMSAARSAYRRSSWYRAIRLDRSVDNMASTLDTAAHDRLRARAAPGYSGRDNPAFEPGVDAQVAALVRLVERRYLTDAAAFRPPDLARAAQLFALDVITRLLYGREPGCLAADADLDGLIGALDRLVPYLEILGAVPVLARLVQSPLLLRAVGPRAGDASGIGKLMGLSHDIIAERYRPGAEERTDMIASFARNGMEQRQCESEALLQIFAGSETTATAIRVVMLHVLAAPSVYARLGREIAARAAAGRISSPITNAEAAGFPYLQAVVQEGLRMQPPSPALVMKQVPPGGDVLHGHFVPGGTRVGHNLGPLVRDKAVFGPDAALFRPERWLAGDAEARLRMRRQLDLVWGHGRWTCPGRDIALMELNKVLVELFRNFDFQLVYPQRPLFSRQHNTIIQRHLWVSVSRAASRE
ncbi:hypothetical protein CDD83_7179 [Cordyceps sp. RAO-2017]|nr:hypothetical protein CDD83_7179 [Cordyceps sp. RAO-2017]